jgi:hypothetical protein
MSGYTASDRFLLQNLGDNNRRWGAFGINLDFNLIDQALDGAAAVTVSGAYVLSAIDAQPDEARCRLLYATGTGGTLTIPNNPKWYGVINATSGTLSVGTSTGKQVPITTGNSALVICDSVDCSTPSPLGAYATPILSVADDTLLARLESGSLVLATQTLGVTLPLLVDVPAGYKVAVKNVASSAVTTVEVSGSDSFLGAGVTDFALQAETGAIIQCEDGSSLLGQAQSSSLILTYNQSAGIVSAGSYWFRR